MGHRMSTFVDPYEHVHSARATVTVSEEPRSAKITYRGEEGETFIVTVYQKPNPIGFRAILPGDMNIKPRSVTPTSESYGTGPRPGY